MKIIYGFAFLFLSGIVHADPVFRDGVIEIEGYNAPASSIAPTDFNAISVSTCVLQKSELSQESREIAGWSSIDEFRETTMEKRALLKRIRQLRRFIENMQDEDGNPSPLAQRLPYIRRLQWLVSYYKSLP